MAIVHIPESAWAKEATKWEAQGSPMGPGLRPYVKREYPMMLHKAGPLPGGGVGIVAQLEVPDEARHRQRARDGFYPTPLDALEGFEAQQREFATLAAERNFEVRRMSPQAQAEVAQAEVEAGAQHLPTIPETPIKRRGRPKRTEAA